MTKPETKRPQVFICRRIDHRIGKGDFETVSAGAQADGKKPTNMLFVFQCYTMGLNRYNLRICIMLAKISNEFLCSISKELGRNRNLYFLILTELEQQVESSAHYFFTCLCHLS